MNGLSRYQRTFCIAAILCFSTYVAAGEFKQKGYFESYLRAFPQLTNNDQAHAVADSLFRYEPSYTTNSKQLSFFGSLQTEIDSHHQTNRDLEFSWWDRTERRPLFSVRRLSALYRKGVFTAELGKQFVRWGKTDILNPTDRFTPKDYVSVIDTEYLAVTAARVTIEKNSNTLDLVYVPRFTPSRAPLIDQRWLPFPSNVGNIPVTTSAVYPGGSQFGIRFGRIDKNIEYSFSYFDGYNPLPIFQPRVVSAVPLRVNLLRTYAKLRAAGGDFALPLRWFTVKSEAEVLTSPTAVSDEYVLYVVQLERQWKEWLFVGGYTGDAITRHGVPFQFAADRGLARAMIGRAQWTIDPNRSLAFEAVVRQNGQGMYGKAEYSQTFKQHWRATLSMVGIGGSSSDFLGQYHHNSFGSAVLRYSF
jgi:hypothetical protein